MRIFPLPVFLDDKEWIRNEIANKCQDEQTSDQEAKETTPTSSLTEDIYPKPFVCENCNRRFKEVCITICVSLSVALCSNQYLKIISS